MSRVSELLRGKSELITFMEKFLDWTQKATSDLRTYGPHTPPIMIASHRIAPWQRLLKAERLRG